MKFPSGAGTTQWLLEADFIKYKCYMSICYKYEAYGTKIIVLSYFDDCVHWYTSKALGKWFEDTFGEILFVNFLGYAHWFVSIRISQMKDHSIFVYMTRYDTSIVAEYLDTATFKASRKFYKPN